MSNFDQTEWPDRCYLLVGRVETEGGQKPAVLKRGDWYES
jgi:hypothetical protein